MEMTPTAEQRLLTAVEPFKPKSLVSLNQLAFKKNQRSPSPQIITETYTKPVVPNLGVMEYSLERGRGRGRKKRRRRRHGTILKTSGFQAGGHGTV